MGDRETIEFVRRQSSTAKYVTSVCTGAFILGVAGLLEGRRATTHWAWTELLPLVGATHEKGRVVKDGNVITAGGVTSGIDFGLRMVAEIAGESVAQAVQPNGELRTAGREVSSSLRESTWLWLAKTAARGWCRPTKALGACRAELISW
jgi:cyclohexyl-isocyanide hydratase